MNRSNSKLVKILLLDGGHFDKVTLTVSNPWRRVSMTQTGHNKNIVTLQKGKRTVQQ